MKKEKTGAIIQARMGSTRFPGKVMKNIGDKPLLGIIVERLKKSKEIDEIIIATSEKEENDQIIEFCKEQNIKYYRGSEKDVLKRYIKTAKKFDIDTIIRVTGDNPLTSPRVIDKLVKYHRDKKNDYTSRTGLPTGVGAEVVNRKVLENTYSKGLDQAHKEHVTYYIRENESKFQTYGYDFRLDEDIRLTVDTKKDLELIKEINKKIGPIEKLSIEKVISFLNENPEIRKINAHIEQKSPDEDKTQISVIIRTYNSESHIERAIESCLDQTLDNDYFEVVIVDDGSEDDTRQILEKYKEEHPDLFKLIFKEHEGPIKSLNKGVKNSKKLLIVLDSDDWFEEEILEKMYRVHEEMDVGFVYSDYYEIDFEESEKKEYTSVDENLFNLVIGGVMFKKEIIEEMDLFDENLIFPEYDLFMKFRKNDIDGYYIEEPLYNYNRTEESITSNPKKIEEGRNELKEKWGKEIKIRDY